MKGIFAVLRAMICMVLGTDIAHVWRKIDKPHPLASLKLEVLMGKALWRSTASQLRLPEYLGGEFAPH
jgi:hypothetical protein